MAVNCERILFYVKDNVRMSWRVVSVGEDFAC